MFRIITLTLFKRGEMCNGEDSARIISAHKNVELGCDRKTSLGCGNHWRLSLFTAASQNSSWGGMVPRPSRNERELIPAALDAPWWMHKSSLLTRTNHRKNGLLVRENFEIISARPEAFFSHVLLGTAKKRIDSENCKSWTPIWDLKVRQRATPKGLPGFVPATKSCVFLASSGPSLLVELFHWKAFPSIARMGKGVHLCRRRRLTGVCLSPLQSIRGCIYRFPWRLGEAGTLFPRAKDPRCGYQAEHPAPPPPRVYKIAAIIAVTFH